MGRRGWGRHPDGRSSILTRWAVITPRWGHQSQALTLDTGTTDTQKLSMANPTTTINASSCLGRTCLKWGADGELTALDLALVMERLAQVDQDVAALRQGSLDREPCPSIS